MNSEQYQYHLVETLQDLSIEELALIYQNYLDVSALPLMNGLVVECYRRGITLTDLEDHLISN